MTRLRQASTGVFLLLVFLYMNMMALIVPNEQLIFAIVLETTWVLFTLSYRYFRQKTLAGRAEKIIVDEIVQMHPIVSKANRWTSIAYLTALIIATSVLCLDFAAFSCAYARNFQACRLLYKVNPLSHLFFLHPALSLEALAGAYIEKRDYAAAEPFFLEIMNLRRDLFDEHHELVAAIYADIGDLCVRRGDLLNAELWFRKSLQSNVGMGRATERLANTLRDRKCYAEARRYYEEALATRIRYFGFASANYEQTAQEYDLLLYEMHLPQTKSAAARQAATPLKTRPTSRSTKLAESPSTPTIASPQSSNSNMSWLTSIVFLVASVYISKRLIGPNGVLTRMVIERLSCVGEAERSEVIKESLNLLHAYARTKAPDEGAKLIVPIVAISFSQEVFAG